MSKQEVIKVTPTRQMIDLNGDSINFNLKFNVSSQEGKQFYIAVLDQNTIDTTENLDDVMKLVDGSISGSIMSDKNIYQNYYLILKSQNNESYDLIVQTEKIELNPNIPESVKQDINIPTESESFFNVKNVIIIVALIGIGIFLYFRFKKNTENKELPINIIDTTSHLSSNNKSSDNSAPFSPSISKLRYS